MISREGKILLRRGKKLRVWKEAFDSAKELNLKIKQRT
jgi:hypothetical protein